MQTMTTFMPPPPAATFLAFHPQDNNIIAIGMDDSSIQIYNVRVDEVIHKYLSGFPIRRTSVVILVEAKSRSMIFASFLAGQKQA